MNSNTKELPLSQAIDTLVEERKMLDHPFYRLWSEGKLSKTVLQEYAKQYYQFVYQFPTFISAIHSNAPTLEARQVLLSNLMDEEVGEKNHPALWLQFCNSVGVTKEDARGAESLTETTELINTFRNLCQKGSFATGVAALYAYESQIPTVSEEKIETLKKYYSIHDSSSLEFFSVHQEADIEHTRISAELLDQIAEPEAKKGALESAEKLASALWKFLDGIYYTYVPEEDRMTCAA